MAIQVAYSTATLVGVKAELVNFASLCGTSNCGGSKLTGNCTLSGCNCSATFGDSHCVLAVADKTAAITKVSAMMVGLKAIYVPSSVVFTTITAKSALNVLLAMTISKEFLNSAILTD